MKCPKCDALFETVSFEQIEARRCTQCGGIWFDALGHEKLADRPSSERIDIGSRRLGKQYDKLDRIDCPTCQSPMVRMVDPTQRHLHFESCSVCGGVFFDAGEFRDYKQHTFMDFVRDLISKERVD